ncbi:CBS domain-containing protein [Blastococcus sp. VKM Ac-2987]|uniref:CBS domain-containing protein n=1 Tax=Blastococcus sp. VKM Ac-2987 TaxID=3004141 RepID=UPI0022AB89B1|nr:CBS domain-containing protein [Blastococcus sp. VKM Ac-2987]MCZ2857506.1 CBS domain-containing protein [Blastococcus sp. VKM Ac-2987]
MPENPPAATDAGLPTVADVMRPPVTTVELTAHLAGAAYLMKRAHDGALVVIDDHVERRPVALLCDADIIQAVADGKDPEQTRITDLHRPAPVTVGPDVTVADAAELMLSSGLQYLPVVEEGRLLGLVDLTLVCRSLLGTQAGAPQS